MKKLLQYKFRKMSWKAFEGIRNELNRKMLRKQKKLRKVLNNQKIVKQKFYQKWGVILLYKETGVIIITRKTTQILFYLSQDDMVQQECYWMKNTWKMQIYFWVWQWCSICAKKLAP